MSEYKLRIKIGQHEFEAAGDADVVKAQFEEFKQLIADQPAAANPAVTPTLPLPSNTLTRPLDQTIPEVLDTLRIEKVVRVDGKKPITLSVLPRGEGREGDAALILLLAYRALWQEEEMAGARILEGLNSSGYNVERMDRLMDRYVDSQEPLVSRTGKRRGVRYRITTRGVQRAKELVKELVATVA